MMISVEAYPQLQSNQNFLNLQRELTDTEDRIAAGRRFYNANVGDYNTRIEAFPSNLIAGMFKFEKAGYFEVEDAEVRSVPPVSFGTIGAVDGEQAPDATDRPRPGQPSSGAVQPQMPGDQASSPRVCPRPAPRSTARRLASSRPVRHRDHRVRRTASHPSPAASRSAAPLQAPNRAGTCEVRRIPRVMRRTSGTGGAGPGCWPRTGEALRPGS